jgi:hypothetical protein
MPLQDSRRTAQACAAVRRIGILKWLQSMCVIPGLTRDLETMPYFQDSRLRGNDSLLLQAQACAAVRRIGMTDLIRGSCLGFPDYR